MYLLPSDHKHYGTLNNLRLLYSSPSFVQDSKDTIKIYTVHIIYYCISLYNMNQKTKLNKIL